LPILGISKLIDYALVAAKEQGFAKAGDKAVVILGSNEEEPDQGDILKIKEVVWSPFPHRSHRCLIILLSLTHSRLFCLVCVCVWC